MSGDISFHLNVCRYGVARFVLKVRFYLYRPTVKYRKPTLYSGVVHTIDWTKHIYF